MPRIVLVPTGQEFLVEPDETVLAAALRAGINLPHSCKGGHCASCRARLLEGSVEHRPPNPAGITAGEVREGYVLLCQALARSDLRIEAREVRPAPDVEIKSLPCRVERLALLAEDVMSVHLRLPAVEQLNFLPGQYVDVVLPDGRRRSFSLANAPADGRLIELHVRRAPGGSFTGQVFATLRPGALLRIEGPLGQFWLRTESPRPPLMVAGGMGYAPLRAMLRQLMAVGDRRPITLYWGARTQSDLYEYRWLRELEAAHGDFVFRPVLSHPAIGDTAIQRTGWVHDAVRADFASLASFDVYAAGPPAMIEAIRASFPSHGLAHGQLHFDSFDYAPDTLQRMSSEGGGPGAGAA